MSQLTANAPLVYELGETNSLPVKASQEIFLGSAVGLTSGYARQLTAGDIFAGFADQHVLEATGADGGIRVPVRTSGRVQLSITSAAVTDIGKPVYASDGNTFTLTASTNTRVGTVVRWVSTGVVVVSFSTSRSATVGTAITDSTGGTPSATFAAITAGGSYAQADMVAVKNALSEIALILNSITQAGQ